jgi:hypothetical protein
MKPIKRLTSLMIGLTFASVVGGSVVTVANPTNYTYAAATCTSAKGFLTFPVWYRGLNVSTSDCNIVDPNQLNTAGNGAANNGLSNFIWRVVLNIMDMALQLVGYIAVGFILYGGFTMIISNGAPEVMAKGRKTILDAIIGLIISIGSVGIINLVMGIIK